MDEVIFNHDDFLKVNAINHIDGEDVFIIHDFMGVRQSLSKDKLVDLVMTSSVANSISDLYVSKTDLNKLKSNPKLKEIRFFGVWDVINSLGIHSPNSNSFYVGVNVCSTWNDSNVVSTGLVVAGRNSQQQDELITHKNIQAIPLARISKKNLQTEVLTKKEQSKRINNFRTKLALTVFCSVLAMFALVQGMVFSAKYSHLEKIEHSKRLQNQISGLENEIAELRKKKLAKWPDHNEAIHRILDVHIKSPSFQTHPGGINTFEGDIYLLLDRVEITDPPAYFKWLTNFSQLQQKMWSLEVYSHENK